MKTIDVALSIIFDSSQFNRVLISKRAPGSHLAGYWEFPGGKLESGENTRDAAEREALEETGLTARIVEELPVFDAWYADLDLKVRLYPFICIATAPPGDAKALSGSEICWVEVDKLDDIEFPEINHKIVQKLRNAIRTLTNPLSRVDRRDGE
jgi:8-oxo-dGTP diphosphatase